MNNIYLQEITENDTALLQSIKADYKKYNPNSNYWVNNNEFPNVVKRLKQSQIDSTKTHIFPFWLMKDGIPIGTVHLKTNIEAEDKWKNYGGHISYTIIPSYRKKGYGTLGLHLALKKCKELGIENALVTCYESNIASSKVIENNYGILKDKVIENFDENHNTQLLCRYIINVDESIKQFEDNIKRNR